MKRGKSEEEACLLCWIRGEDTVGTRSNTKIPHALLENVFLVVVTQRHNEVVELFAILGRAF